MRQAPSVLATLAILTAGQSAAADEIAITLDDLPYVMPSRTSPAEGLAQVEAINQALAAHGIIATGFAVGSQITRRSLPALEAFADAGHTIGNHSWSHPDYGTLTVDAFREETRRTDEALADWIDETRLYRFPFLREGETPEAKAAAEDVLAELDYVNVPVTIDNDEWQLNADYLDALEEDDTAAAEEIAARYIAHMQERTGHFRSLAREAMGRDVKHILLLHMNRINADHLDDLLDWYVAERWTFITVKEAMTDPLYAAPDLYSGARGLSQIERVMGRKSE